MAHYGILRTTAVSDAAEDIRGASLYGTNDEKLGKIDDVIFDHSTGDIRYVVVDTGGWLSTKKFVVPAGNLRGSAKHEKDYEVNLSKKQVEGFPPYNESDLESEDKWSGYEEKYRAKWVSDPVMHRADTDRNISPTTYQQSGNYDSERAASIAHGGSPADFRRPVAPTASTRADVDAASSITERAVPAGADAVVISSSATGIGDRWDTFQSRLRERRKEAIEACTSCTDKSAVKPGSESPGRLRKAV